MKRIINNLVRISIGFLFLLIVISPFVKIIEDLDKGLKFTDINYGYLINQITNGNTYKSMFHFNEPVVGIAYIIIAFLLFQLLKNLEWSTGTYKEKAEYGAYGTSRWSTHAEIRKTYFKKNTLSVFLIKKLGNPDKKILISARDSLFEKLKLNLDDEGWFLGTLKKGESYKIGMKGLYHRIDQPLNSQVLVVGPPGSMKTTAFAINQIFHLSNVYENSKEKADQIIIDPKGELINLSRNYLEEKGYEVKCLNFVEMNNGDMFNPIPSIANDKELLEISKGYITSCEKSDGGTSQFYNDQEGQLLASLIGFVKQTCPIERQTFFEITKILGMKEFNDLDFCTEYFDKNNIKGAALTFWNNFLNNAQSPVTRAGIVGGLSTKLNPFAIKGIQTITSKSTIDIKKLGTTKSKPIALFIMMPVSDRTFSPIINTIITIIFKQLYRTGHKTRDKLPSPVYFLLEEFANIGIIPNMLEMLGTMRGLRVYPMVILQSLAQLKNMYGTDGSETLIAQFDTTAILGVNDLTSAEYVSKLLGTKTIMTEIPSINNGIKTVNKSYQPRPLLFASEVREIKPDEVLIIPRGYHPCYVYKAQYKYWKEKELICPIIDATKIIDTVDEIERINPIKKPLIVLEEDLYTQESKVENPDTLDQ
ncbi:VirD4-like conjugal transfer protein, CD1115 family [Clostridium estertheticum]|uniref:VirD4-like conjugal transfer protein, CD1115 family n=1 Tax=Clostridium estertheticum TaxID=238834 RepID=UPI001C0AD1D9|nr:type IV secretory system conjugative DNA transfer family protein [Clostridium estertheticum]MBU3174406.1 type IV secretory system conjugative DNA transfer family protein [Clostridium estertheticum]